MVDLSGLRDIHIPIKPSWWPPAIGWWILSGAILLLLFVCFMAFLYWYNRPKQYALRELKKISTGSVNDVLMARQVSALLKRISLMLYPRTRVASLTDDKWVEFLIAKTGTSFSESQLELLSQATYMPEQSLSADKTGDLYRAARQAVLKLFEGIKNGRKSKKSS